MYNILLCLYDYTVYCLYNNLYSTAIFRGIYECRFAMHNEIIQN